MPRSTKQRQAIWQAIHASKRPLTPQEILDLAQAKVAGLGIATVYRNISLLLDEELVKPVSVPGSAPRYELARLHHHHHFHCRTCGKVFEVEGCPPGIDQLTPRGFTLEAHDVVLYGRCEHCN